MAAVLYGAGAALCFVAALFFARFWSVDRDRFFLYFASAFVVLGAHSILIVVADTDPAVRYFLYLPRLIAFLLIIVGIVDKNRRRQAR